MPRPRPGPLARGWTLPGGSDSPLRILILNWRDRKHPRAGGAEVFTYEVARRLAAHGDAVEWFAAGFPGGAAEEELDGVRIVRCGRQATVHWQAFRHYRGQVQHRFDVVIDEVNTIPFFTPWWVRVPTFLLMFQLAREVWWHESPFPICLLGYLAEAAYLRAYRRVPIFTVSASTKSDLSRLGLRGPITIVPIGIETVQLPAHTKASVLTCLYVGRLSPSKRVHHVIRAFAEVRRRVKTARLWLIGEGAPAYARSLQVLVNQLGLNSAVRFWGRLPTEEKHQRMAEAHALLLTSVREGWGLVVSEANACGTPAVVYDVGGLRDSVRHEQTGLVVHASPRHLADAVLRLWNDPALYRRLADEALRWAATFSFDKAAATIRAEIVRSLAG